MAALVNAFVSKLCEMLSTYAKEEAVKILAVPDEIEKLQRRMERIQDVLADAENRRFENQAINRWLNELRDLTYDADDIIDECRIEGEKLLGSNSSSSRCVESVRCRDPPIALLHKVRFRHEIGNRIRYLNLKLEELAKDKTDLHLAPAPRDDHYKRRISNKTSPVFVQLDVVGEKIEDDTRMLVDLLIEEDKKNISVFAIVGMGGIGKTTLAQKIYNDEKLRDNFHQMPRMWLCVTQDFSESDLLRSIIKQAGGDPGEHKEKEVLEPMLSRVIRNKKFFLILDDIWDAQVWNELLRKPLQSGLVDSRILITSRNINIAKQMDAIYSHTVEKLSREDGWSLIRKMVFKEGNEQDMHELSDTGMKIVDKCDGLPLALRTVGGVLRTKAKRQSEWVQILSNPAWSSMKLPDGVMGALYLSYQDLPPPLKQCFTCLSLFPKDFVIHEGVFVNSCIAEGFVISEEGVPLEDVAKGYWKELVQRNLLQPDPIWYDESACRMHDLLRSLAQHIAGDECFVGDARAFENKIMDSSSSIKLRHLCIVDGNIETIPDLIMDRTSLRTLSFFHSPLFNVLPEDLFGKLRSLRVLNLSETNTNKVPTSLGDLVHLRRLDLRATPIREIPKSIGNLRNLQFLILQNCKYLHSLPSSVLGLVNLRFLDVQNVPLDGLPRGIGRLQQLNTLLGFVVNGSEGRRSGAGGDVMKPEHRGHQHGSFCTLEELRSLSHFRSLSIYKLERASNRTEARAAALQAKPHLTMLHLCCTLPSSCSDANDYEEEEIKRIGEVFEELRPAPCLEVLQIHGFFGRQFPSWMITRSSSFLRNLRRLVLKNCAPCQQLPPLGMLPQLDYLCIKGASAVMRIGREFLLLGSCCSSYFPKLETLTFEDMPNWEEWWWRREEVDNQTTSWLPSLKVLTIGECPKLRSLPESLLCRATALKRLNIKGAHSLREIQNLRSLTELLLMDNSSLERVSNFSALKDLSIHNCEELKVVEGVDAIEHIELDDREAENSLPEWVLNLSETNTNKVPTSLGDLVHLRRLDLRATPIREIPKSIGNLRNLQFLILQNCKYLHSLPSSVLGLVNLRFLDVQNVPLDGLPRGIGRLQQLNTLLGFVVNGSEGRRSGAGGDVMKPEHRGHQHGSFCTLEELRSLSHFRSLSIYKLERASNRTEARAAALQAKPHLTMLHLCCTLPSSCSDANDYEEEEIKRIGEVFEELRPAPCLEVLQIHGFFGRQFPSWMITRSSSFLRNLRRLVLKNCAPCQQLPPLGMLPQLDYLCIKGASAVMRIGREFLLLGSCCSSYFPKLETLTFEDMPNWEEWWWRREEVDNQTTSWLPSLKVLTIGECPKLRSLPESLLCRATALKRLNIKGAHSLREIQNLRSLTELLLMDNSSLERVSNFSALKDLSIHNCEELKVVEGVDAIEHIELDDREAENSLPEWLVGISHLQQKQATTMFVSCNKQSIERESIDDCKGDGVPDFIISPT
ncbi:putative disease resistance protein RGA3 [Cocos nucifera]|uniref:Putative disease resistance protein RGA3 n=1 Tax=Cocos nucifera TaxID=13894 RepID=A0A8K0HSU9_COCNU|nr:putative disease resistance protein RGA3 [Cocos nucifera]